MSTIADDGQEPQTSRDGLRLAAQQGLEALKQVFEDRATDICRRELGSLKELERGIARVIGLPNVQSNEVLRFSGNRRGFAFNLDRHEVGCVLLDDSEHLHAGSRVERMGSVVDAPVGDELLGRVIDPIGRPLDDGRSLLRLGPAPL